MQGLYNKDSVSKLIGIGTRCDVDGPSPLAPFINMV